LIKAGEGGWLAYKTELKQSAKKEFLSLSDTLQTRISHAIDGLATNPRPEGFKPLKGVKNTFRIRKGDYRVVYEVHAGILTKLIIRIAHRHEVYR
jgi:mRNA interferase RelE/StbE